jgi:hypothetical protein
LKIQHMREREGGDMEKREKAGREKGMHVIGT